MVKPADIFWSVLHYKALPLNNNMTEDFKTDLMSVVMKYCCDSQSGAQDPQKGSQDKSEGS